MPYFIYKAKDRKGDLITGTMEAETASAAASRLQVMGYFPLNVEGEAKEKDGGFAGWVARFDAARRPVTSRDITSFYRQMSDLVGAGVPLVKSLGVVKTQCPNPQFQSLLSQIDQDVQGGDTFARALARHPKIFNKLSTAMIHAGETGGLLEETLARLADFAEAEEELIGRVKGALAYPAIMITAGMMAVAVLMIFVIPRIVGMFEELNQQLPFATVVLINISWFISTYWYVVIGAAIALVALIRRYRASTAGRVATDSAMLKVPILGEVVLKRELARFTRTLGSLLRNGVPILQAIGISAEVLTNRIVQREIEPLPEGITQGGGMAQTLRQSKIFPPVVTNMIAIGEETGNLPGVLLKVAKTYEEQVDRALKTLTSVIEPVIILCMGLLVGFIVISMLLPIFSLDPTAGG